MRSTISPAETRFPLSLGRSINLVAFLVAMLVGQATALCGLTQPVDVVLDIYLTDRDSNGGGVWRIRDGVTTLISATGGLNGGVTIGGGDVNFIDPRGIVIQNATTLIVADDGRPAIIFIDINTGNRTRLGGLTTRDQPVGIAYDAVNGYIYFTDAQIDFFGRDGNSIVRVNADGSGGRTVISSNDAAAIGSGPALNGPHDLTLDGDRLIVANRGTNELLSVDVTTGVRTLLSGGAGPTGSGTNYANPYGVQLYQGALLVADGSANSLFLVDPTTGDRTLVTDALAAQPQDAVLDGQGNAYVALSNESLVLVNLSTGAITDVASVGAGDFDPTFTVFDRTFLAVAIPEPTSLMLLASIGAACSLSGFRRRRSNEPK